MLQLTTWLNNPVKPLLLVAALCASSFVSAQQSSLTLKEALQMAERNYPVTGQRSLLKQSEELSLRNISSNFLPQVSFNGQATYQSDVTKVNIPIPGIKVPAQAKDQYKAYADISQLLFDGGLNREQKSLQLLNTEVEQSRLNIELHNLKSRISQLYFSILYQQELLNQTNLLVQDIQHGIDKVRPQVENGTVLRSSLLVLEAQKLQVQQRAIEIRNTSRGLMNALSTLLKIPFTETTSLETPSIHFAEDSLIDRPEVTLFDSQVNLLQQQKSLVDARIRPRLSAFAQAGYGRPGLNMFSTSFDPYYIAGIRANWSIGSLYNRSREKQLLDISQRTVDLQKETFMLNTRSQLEQQKADIRKYMELVESDQTIIDLRKRITAASKAQLENAVITTNDYLREINAEDQARQNLIIHQIQLLQAKANYAITAGKL